MAEPTYAYDLATFLRRFGGAARTKHVQLGRPDDAAYRRTRRPYAMPTSPEIPPEFIRLDPWEMEYLFTVARRARVGIVETGRFNGGSLFVMACAAPVGTKLWSVDIAPQDDGVLKPFLDRFCGHAEVELIVGDSQQGVYPHVEQVDLAFIDGDHSYEGCLADIRNWERRLTPGGHLLFHDAYLGGHGVQDAIHDFLDECDAYETVLSPFIPSSHWWFPAGSFCHLRKRR